MTISKTRLLAVAAALTIAVTTGCTGVSTFGPQDPVPGAANCEPASPAAGPDQNFAVLGTPLEEGVTASGLFFADTAAAQSPSEALERKFVVQISGNGELGAELVNPSGDTAELAQVPELEAADGSLQADVEEWAMRLKFDEPGCWNLTLTRDETPTAAFWFEIG